MTAATVPTVADSILCNQERWRWHDYRDLHVSFNKDGTGRLCWFFEHTWILDVVLDWQIISEQPYPTNVASDSKHPRLLAKFDLRIQLHKALPSSAGAAHVPKLLDRYFLPAAFEPKQFTITAEQGNFRTACYVASEESPNLQDRCRFGLRLKFNNSLFPPRKDWVTPHHGAIAPVDPDNFREAVSQRLPAEQSGGVAMNQLTAWQQKELQERNARYEQEMMAASVEKAPLAMTPEMELQRKLQLEQQRKQRQAK